jgi:adenylate kinase
LRAEVASNSPRGQEINNYISQGLIVPIEIVIETIVTAIAAAPTEVVIIDGYPRSLEQMSELDNYLQKHQDITLVSVIEVRVNEATARERVLGRARGADDDEKVFENRMKVYTQPLEEIRTFYTNKNIFHVISGESSIEEIVSEMEAFILSKI